LLVDCILPNDKGMPKRPLSAYNIFFRKERQVLLGEDLALEFEITDQTRRKHRKTHGKIGFAEMAKLVGQRWKKLDTTTKQGFEEQANAEKKRYVEHLEVWKKAQEEDPTEEPTETTEYMGDEPIIIQVDRGIMRPTPMEASLPKPQALPQAETAHFPTKFQKEEDYTNEPRFHGRNAYLPTTNASLPANFGGNAPISTIWGRTSLPGNLPSHYGDSTPYAIAQGRASLSGGPPDTYQVPPRGHNSRPDGRIWPPQAASATLGRDPFYWQAQKSENERVLEMEEMYRMHLAEAAIIRERLGQRGDTGTAIDHLRQQPSAYPGLMQMQARHASSASRDMMNTGTTIDHLRQQPSAYPGLMPMQARRASSAPHDVMNTGTTINNLQQQPSAYPGNTQMHTRRASSVPHDMMDTGTTIDHLQQQPSAYPGNTQMHTRRASNMPRDMMDTGTTIDHLRQQLSAYPSQSQTQARRSSDSPGDTMDMGRGQAHMIELLIIERAQVARQADMIALQRVVDNQRVLRQEEELRKRRGL
jgi:hypothetical protein